MSTEQTCTHCKLPVPAALYRVDQEHQFCCAGCRAVYALLRDSGLEQYYDYADGTGKPAVVTDRSYAEFDDPTFIELYCKDVGDGHKQISLYLEGVHCTACIWLIEKLPSLKDGVLSSRLDLGRSKATIVFDPSAVDLSAIARFLDSLGYAAHPYRGADIAATRRREDRTLLIKLAVAGAAAANVMLMALALYVGMFSDMGEGQEHFFRWASMVVTLTAVGYSGSVFFRGAISALRVGALHMDLPISVGIAAGTLWGIANTVRGVGEIYFDSVTMLIFLLLIGRWLQTRQHRQSIGAAEMLYSLTPRSARVVADGLVRDVPIEAVMTGMTVEVRAGDTIPVDGTVVSGRSQLNRALLTGESRPESVSAGDAVCAGSVNVSASLRIVAAATGEETRLGVLIRQIDEYAARKSPIVLLADRLAGIFVSTALGLAVLTVTVWWSHGPAEAIEHAMALLIVTCPCALGLATPLAMSFAVGRAAKSGILIKGADTIERLAVPGLIFLDKTGTVTEGLSRVVEWHGDTAVKSLVGALEAHSSHHVARALAVSPTAHTVEDVCEVPGAGIRGRVNGRVVVVGSPLFVATEAGVLDDTQQAVIETYTLRALSPVVVAVDGHIQAVCAIGDPLRADAASTVADLRRRGWRVGLLSGDHPDVVHAVGESLGIPADLRRGGASPEEKLAVVRRATEHGRVVMVGDGVNDAAALAAATSGIAVHGSAEASLSAADVFIDRPGLAPVAELLDGTHKTMAVVRRNLIFSLGYNLIGAGLAISGLIHPLIAAVMMPISSLTVVSSSLRTRAFTKSEENQ